MIRNLIDNLRVALKDYAWSKFWAAPCDSRREAFWGWVGAQL